MIFIQYQEKNKRYNNNKNDSNTKRISESGNF